MNLTDKQLLDDLKAGKYLPVYLITGEENYYIDVLSDYFEDNIVDEGFRDFDQTVVYGRDVNMSQVVGLAKQFPMMSPVKLVLVKEAQDINVKEWDLLADYLEHPLTQTLLVLCYRHKKLDKRTRAYKAIAKVGGICEHNRLYDSQVPSWIGTYVNQRGFAITQRASVLIAESIGNDLGKMANELDKVFISLNPGDTINDDIIERNIGISKEYNVFELQSAIGRRDVVQCNRIINHFAANPKDNPIQLILPVLYGYFIKVMVYHQLEDKSEAASALKVNPYFVRDYEVAASNYPLGKLASCIGYLNEADLRSKGIRNAGTVTDGELLKELIFKIIH
ncbi:MAG: DNA polymerase III subunit delta [Bacteroidales bacterium]|nr:DNA polymerase III subunit delta [Bacteroidales bacterium]